ncbi:hypothetical protein [Streptomyces sp. NPDC057253]|uniref:hypothetical protein n=1 Tax=Streptomyces sp. NPDC057253 TaxID=3346069 RepID=UPI0036311BA8
MSGPNTATPNSSEGCAAMDRATHHDIRPIRPDVASDLWRYQPIAILHEVLAVYEIADARQFVESQADVFRECRRLVIGSFPMDVGPLAFPATGERTAAGRLATSAYGLRQNTDTVYAVHPSGVVLAISVLTYGDAADADVTQDIVAIAYRKLDALFNE